MIREIYWKDRAVDTQWSVLELTPPGALACDGTAQSCSEGEAVIDGLSCISEGRVGRCLEGVCCIAESCLERRECGDWANSYGGVVSCGATHRR